MSYGNCNGRDMVALKNSMSRIPGIRTILKNTNSKLLQNLYNNLDELSDMTELIEQAIVDEPPITVKDGGLIKLRL